ncbi:MAG: MotA/TolQ/ExbB proton channel family protein [Collimonas sp.]|uniref:MotA/TolQ/ExbB proton channel family protein n=1 Tax=Collimonas sp. TaxID=1963772 RepID=UPI003266E910
MNIIELFHSLTFYAMYGAAALAVFVIIERQIFYMTGRRDASAILRLMAGAANDPTQIPDGFKKRKSTPAQLLREAMQFRDAKLAPARLEDLSEAIYLSSRSRVIARLWILDTIVTAAPLLGLVGTILGIIDTFSVLASSGISDPSGVSKGIGTALYATALGISIALFGLLFYNFLRECSDRLNDQLKELLLRITDPSH